MATTSRVTCWARRSVSWTGEPWKERLSTRLAGVLACAVPRPRSVEAVYPTIVNVMVWGLPPGGGGGRPVGAGGEFVAADLAVEGEAVSAGVACLDELPVDADQPRALLLALVLLRQLDALPVHLAPEGHPFKCERDGVGTVEGVADLQLDRPQAVPVQIVLLRRLDALAVELAPADRELVRRYAQV